MNLRPVRYSRALKAPPRFLIASGQMTRDPTEPHANPGDLHKGFGSFRRPFARFLEGAILEPAGRGPNAAQPEQITVSELYIRR
jgi:hypothetical protein